MLLLLAAAARVPGGAREGGVQGNCDRGRHQEGRAGHGRGPAVRAEGHVETHHRDRGPHGRHHHDL